MQYFTCIYYTVLIYTYIYIILYVLYIYTNHTYTLLYIFSYTLLYIYYTIYAYIGISMKQADILLLIDAFDSDGDGRVSIQEFIAFIGMICICMHMCMYDCTYYMLSACMMYDSLYR